MTTATVSMAPRLMLRWRCSLRRSVLVIVGDEVCIFVCWLVRDLIWLVVAPGLAGAWFVCF